MSKVVRIPLKFQMYYAIICSSACIPIPLNGVCMGWANGRRSESGGWEWVNGLISNSCLSVFYVRYTYMCASCVACVILNHTNSKIDCNSNEGGLLFATDDDKLLGKLTGRIGARGFQAQLEPHIREDWFIMFRKWNWYGNWPGKAIHNEWEHIRRVIWCERVGMTIWLIAVLVY